MELGMWLVEAVLSAIVNLILLAGLPFLGYYLFHRLRHQRSLREVALRAGLRRGELRYLGYSAAFAAAGVVLLIIWPPPLDSFTQPGSPQADFVGLGLGGQAITLALLYGLVKTGFSEELFFRGLIAGSLERRMPFIWANLLQALIFLLPHGLVLLVMPRMWWLLPVVFAMALFNGWVRCRSGSILGPSLIHGCVNVAVCLSVAYRSAG
jgi:membrane protease YdiL (CAAX protease family)